MIKVSILYPNLPGERFDFGHYLSAHIPRSVELLGAHPGFRGISVERGVSGAEPGSTARYIAACFFVFDTIDSFVAAFMPHADELRGDMQNYTDIQPEIQFNEIMLERGGG